METKIRYIILLIAFLINSCSTPHYFYQPNYQLVPLFKEPSKLTISPAFSTSIINKCFELQAGYSLKGHIALMSGLMIGGNNDSGGTFTDYCRIRYFEGSIGYYTSLSDIFVLELFGGFGGGSQSHRMTYNSFDGWDFRIYDDGYAKLSLSKLFLQGDFGVNWKWIMGAFSCRISRLGFKDLQYSGVTYNLPKLNTIENNKTPVCIEPALTIGLGSKPVKFVLQCNFSEPIGAQDIIMNYVFEKSRVVFGLIVNFSTKPKIAEQK